MENLNLTNKNSDAVIRETAEFFADQGYSVLNSGFAEIVTNPKLFGAYKEAMLEGVNADNAVVMGEIMDNGAKQIINEAVSGIAPLSSLSMPVIRKLWPKVAMKESMKNIVAKAPIFSISYMKPYLYKVTDGVEERIDLPRGAFKTDFDNNDKLAYAYIDKPVTVAGNGAFAKVYFLADTAELNAKAAVKTPLDGDFEVVSLVTPAVAASGDVPAKAAETLVLGEKMGLTENMVVTKGDYTVVVKVNLKGAFAEVAVFGGTGDFTVNLKAHKSSEWNEESWDVGFDVERQEVRIGTGDHIQAPLSIERIQDLQALYNIDAMTEVTDLMTNTFAQKVDRELIDFIINCFVKRPKNKEFGDYGAPAKHIYEFNVAPSAGYAGSPKAWREELKPVIDYAATAIIQETYFTSGTFVICGNPVDTALLTNIDWQYKGGTSGNVDGVDITYNIGIFQSAYTFKVISSLNIKPGKLMMSFIPSGDKQLTQAYYPYTFTMEKGAGYRSANHSLVPSLMLTKRHTMFEYTPSVAMIVITGNTGTGQFNRGNLWSNVFAGTNGAAVDPSLAGLEQQKQD